jgi:hypothetical protein
MKVIFKHADSAQVGLYKSFLDEAGIACFIQNDAGGVITSVPFYPTLCVVNDADADQARRLLADREKPAATAGRDWICPHCQSLVPAGFDQCWNCERERGSVH